MTVATLPRVSSPSTQRRKTTLTKTKATTRPTVLPPSIQFPPPWVDHTYLPEEDGTFVKNFQEHPESILLTDSGKPMLKKLHPDGNYIIGQDCGIYWQWTDPPQDGAEAPDWFYVPGVPPTLKGVMRRSYVMWNERVPPMIVIEFVSGDGTEEKDTTPFKGKFWVYETAICPSYYAIYYAKGEGKIELYKWQPTGFVLVKANERNHYPIPPMKMELGIWKGEYMNVTLPWLRWWDDQGNLLPLNEELAQQERQRAEEEHRRAEAERQRAEREQQQAEQERQRAERLAAQIRALGLEPVA